MNNINSIPQTKQPSLFDLPHRDDFFITWPIYKTKVNAQMKLENEKVGELRIDGKGKFYPHESRLSVYDRYHVDIIDIQIIQGTLYDLYEIMPTMGDIYEKALEMYAEKVENKKRA